VITFTTKSDTISEWFSLPKASECFIDCLQSPEMVTAA
jgi:hypothetical protein